MAKQVKGFLYGFRGKLGDMVGSSWRGIPVVRKAPGPRKSPPSPTQIRQQEKFKMLVQFFVPLKGLLDQTFKNSAKRMSCLNKAMSQNKMVIVGEYPDYRIDYAGVTLCPYSNLPPWKPRVFCTKSGSMIIFWENGGKQTDLENTELFFIAVYCAVPKEWIYKLYPQKGYDGTFHLDLAAFSGYTVQTYIGFNSRFRRPFSWFAGSVDIL